MDKPDLDIVFAAKPGDAPAGPLDEMPPMDGEETAEGESEAALDLAIDDIFATEDPTARREAFKRAIELCKESHGEGGY